MLRIDLRRRQPGVADEPPEATLELGPRRRGVRRQRVEVARGDEAADERLGGQGLERVGAQVGRQVSQRSSGAVTGSPLTRVIAGGRVVRWIVSPGRERGPLA